MKNQVRKNRGTRTGTGIMIVNKQKITHTKKQTNKGIERKKTRRWVGDPGIWTGSGNRKGIFGSRTRDSG